MVFGRNHGIISDIKRVSGSLTINPIDSGYNPEEERHFGAQQRKQKAEKVLRVTLGDRIK
jgi:hypothetical protein